MSFIQTEFVWARIAGDLIFILLAVIESPFVWSEELGRSRQITLSEICIILQIILSLIQ